MLSFNYRRNGEGWQDVEQPAPIVHVPCRFGGHRPCFQCSGVGNEVPCGRRVAKLYAAGRYFLCQHCYGLAYASQSEGERDRAPRRTGKIRMRLGGDPSTALPFPDPAQGYVAANL